MTTGYGEADTIPAHNCLQTFIVEILAMRLAFYYFVICKICLLQVKPCRVGSVGSVSASRTVGREFASHKNGTNCLPAWHAMR